MTNIKKILEEFDEQYSPIIKDQSNSSWKYGAPSPNSMKIFLTSKIAQAVAEAEKKLLRTLLTECDRTENEGGRLLLTSYKLKNKHENIKFI